jgi:hypothetical protein
MADDWSYLLKFDKSGLATDKNGADIPDGMLQTAAHCIFDKGVLEVAPGRTAKYTQLESGASVDGIFRSFDNLGNKDTLVACNGKIKYDTGSAWGDLQTGLTASIDYDWVNWKDRTFIINGTDDAYEFYPRTNAIQKAGLEPPRFIKKVAYFETDETINTGDSGIAVDTVYFRPTERTGNNRRSLKITAGAGATVSGYVTYSSAQNFSIFPNGGSVSDNDFICISIFHRIRAYVSAISIDFYTSSGNYYRASIDPTELDAVLQRNNQWTDIKIRRSRFEAVGSPNWASVARFYVNLTGVTGSAVVNFDNVYIKNAPIIATSYGKVIENFEGATADWTTDFTISNNMDYRYVKQGTKSLKLVRTGASDTAYKVVSLNLAYHVDGVASPTSDEITCWVYCTNTANLTNIKLRLYSDTATPKHFTYTFTPGGTGGLNSSSAGVWSKLLIAKALFTDTGTADWSAIIRIEIEANTTGACTLYFDDWKLEEKSAEKAIATMETTESWVWSNEGSFNTNKDYKVQGNSSIYIKCPAKKSYNASLVKAVDLSIFGATETSSDDDYICFYMKWNRFKTIQKIEVWFDINDGDYGDSMFYEITPEELVTRLNMTGQKASKIDNLWLYMEVQKSKFTRVGTAAKTWADVAAVKFIVYGASKGNPVTVWFDDLHMRRKTGLTGIYQFACAFVNSNNEPSALSEWSDLVELAGSRAVLSLIPVSQDASVIGRLLFRKGGDLGDEARLDEIIWDNTTTTYYTGLEDYETGMLASDDSIPQGTIRFPSITKFGPAYKNRLTGYGDAAHPEYLYFTNTGFWYAWSELQAWKFDSKILDAWADDDVLFVNTLTGIRRIRVDLAEITADDIEEIGVVKHSMGPWASCSVEGSRAFVGYDGVYLMSGSQVQGPISDAIEDKFTGSTYSHVYTKAIYRNKHLWLSIKAASGGARSLLDCYLPEQKWRTSDYTICCFCIFNGPGDAGELYGATTDGYVYRLDTGYASTLAVTTKDYPVSENPFDRVLLTEIWVKGRSAESDAGAVQIQFRLDQVADGTTLNFPHTGHIATTYTSYYENLRDLTKQLKGSKIGMSIAPSVAGKHLAIEAILLKGKIIGEPYTLEEG